MYHIKLKLIIVEHGTLYINWSSVENIPHAYIAQSVDLLLYAWLSLEKHSKNVQAWL